MDLKKPEFIVLDHTADLGIMVRGNDITDLFEQTALAMMQIMISSGPAEKSNSLKLSLKGEDLAELMVHWLGEILYLFHGEKKVVIHIRIDSISPSNLDATLETVSFSSDLHEILCEIKAVTFHQIQVEEKNSCWEAKIIFDV